MQKTRLSYDEEETFRKKLIALLLSGADNPIASKVNFQKELFLLIKAMPQFESIFDFMPHRLGPYSNSAEHIIENNPELFVADNKGIYLSDEGKQFSSSVKKEMHPENFLALIQSITFIRSIYDHLNDDELMFLVYMTYGYTEKSDRFDALLKRRKQLADSLLRKKVITHQRYVELLKG
ncbi:MAG: hypothetical protein NTW33_02135 [Methanoregula sp.]|nr:hypothetical protein [Methanoregula sp.]